MTKLVRTASLALLLAPLWICALAQSPPQETRSNDSAATFRSRVNLVMVPVVIRDKTGKAVGDLKKEDFQLFDKGKAQVISRFALEKSTDQPVFTAPAPAGRGEKSSTSPAAIPASFAAYVFDDINTEAGDLANARDAADKHVKDTLRATDRAAVFTTSGQTMLDFTSDRQKIHDALFALRSRSRHLGQTECPPMTYYMADLIQTKRDLAALDVAITDAKICADTPSTDLARQMSISAASRTLATGDMETKTVLGVLRDVVSRMSAAPGQRALILASAGFLITDDYRNEESELMDRAIAANVIISAVDARGLYVISPCGDLSQKLCPASTAIAKANYQRETALSTEGTLAEVADGTGGTFFHNSNDLVEGLRRVAAPPEYIYMLGFSPEELKLDGKFHALQVTIRNSGGYTLQARHGYFAPKYAIDATEQAMQELKEALYSRGDLHDIPLDLETQFVKAAADDAKLTVTARVDVRQLHFQKVNGRNDDSLTFIAGVFDNNGNLIGAVQKKLDMKLKDETLASPVATGVALNATFDMTPGKYVVRFVVRDSEGQMMGARNGVVDIP